MLLGNLFLPDSDLAIRTPEVAEPFAISCVTGRYTSTVVLSWQCTGTISWNFDNGVVIRHTQTVNCHYL